MGLERRARSLSAGGPQCAGGRKGRTLAARLSYVSGRLRHGFRAWLDGAASSAGPAGSVRTRRQLARSEEHTSELQSLMRISYAVFCLKTKLKQSDPTMNNEMSS